MIAAFLLGALIVQAGTIAPLDTAGQPAIVDRAPIDTTAPVNFRVLVTPDTVYVGQQTTYELGVFLDANVRDRLRRMEAIAPEMRGMMAYEPPAPLSGFAMRTVGTHRYEAHVYQRAIFPLTAGRFAIPPARLVYAMPLSYSFFSREESYELRSDSAIIVAVEPPRASRPADWAGAVGELHVSAEVDTSTVRVGDPVRLTVRVEGWGNVKLLPRPQLAVPWAAAIPSGERVALASDSLHVHGDKEFDWVLTPLHAGQVVLPPIRYPYFDPIARRYDVATTTPLDLDITAGTLAAVDTGPATQARWAVRSVYRGPLAPEPYSRRAFWWVIWLAPLPAAMLLIARRPHRPRAPLSPPRALHALAEPGAPRNASHVRRAFLAATSARVRVSATTLAEPRALERALRRAGTSQPTAAAAAALLEELNAAAFGLDTPAAADIALRADRVYCAIDAESRTFRSFASAVVPVVLTLGLATGAAVKAAAPMTDAMQFARGVQAYDHGHYALAARDFAAIATRVPRAADAWANLGTAAFEAGDTARAMLGWERALRLEPLATDVRDRLDFISAVATSGPGAVPDISPLPLALAAAALWVGGWLFLAWRAYDRRARTAALLVASALGGALLLGGTAALIDHRLAARDLVIAAQDVPLRLLPALGAEHGATMRTGEIARVTERDGVWEHVVTDGGRDGWAAATSLYSIARD